MTERFGKVDHTPFGGLGVELVFGRRPDESLVHISAVPSGLACGCICPACGGVLVARKGPKVADHFAHHVAGEGCGLGAETNAHIWAKLVLERTRQIWLPAVKGQVGGRERIVRKAAPFTFEAVRLEKRMGEIVPDVICRAKDRELIVEVWVTHKCDDAKITKIRTAGVSAIEVDLRRYRTANSQKDVEKALLQSAPRAWLQNHLIGAAEDQLRREIAAEKAQAARATERMAKRTVGEIRAAPASAPKALCDLRDELDKLGLRSCFSQEVDGGDGFVVPRTLWQAALFARAFVRQAGKPRWDRSGVDAGYLLDKIRDCLAPAFNRGWSQIFATAVLKEAPDFRFPERALEEYLETLAAIGVLHDDGGYFSLTDHYSTEIAERLRCREEAKARSEQLARRVGDILSRIPEEEQKGFTLKRWLKTLHGTDRLTPDQACAADSSIWWRFSERIVAVEGIMTGREPPDDLLGLPLGPAADRARQRIAEQEAERLRRVEAVRLAAIQARIKRVTDRAVEVMHGEAQAWLARPGKTTPLTPTEAAAQGDTGLEAALRALTKIADDRASQARLDQQAADARQALRKAALERLPEEHADLFMNSGNPGIAGQRPGDYCQDQATLKICLHLLRSPRARRR